MRLSKGIKASAVYTIASFLTKGISFITVPIFTRIMPSAEIGVSTTFASWMSILGVLAALGTNTGAYNIAMNEYPEQRDQYAVSCLAITSVASCLIGIIYIVFFNAINSFVGLPWQLMALMIIGFIVQPATDFWMIRQRYEYKYLLSSIVSVGTALLSSALAIASVVIAKNKGIVELGTVRVFSTYIIYDLAALVLFIHLVIKGKATINKQFVVFALQVSLPMMVHSFAKHILDASDKIMIQRIVGNSAVGIYGTLFTLSTLSLIFWNAINASLVPYMFSNLSDKERGGERINRVLFPMIVFYGIVAVMLALISPEVVQIIAPPEYYEAIYLMPPVAAGIFFTSIYNIMGNILLYHKQSVKIMIATLIAAGINIILNYIFISKYGYIAAAYTTLFANIILALCQYFMARLQHGKLPFDEHLIWAISGIITIAILMCNILYKHVEIRYAVILIGCVAIFIKRHYFINMVKKIIVKQ